MQKGSTLIFLLVGILILAVAGGAIYLSRQTTPKSSPVPATVSQTPTPSPLTSDETANWKTYTNQKFNYSIKYPINWEVKECPQDSNCNPLDHNTHIYSTEKFGGAHEPLIYEIFISKLDNPNKLDFKNLVTKDLLSESKENFTYTEEQINRMTVFRTTSIPSMLGCEDVYFKKEDGSYIGVTFCPYAKKDPFPQQDRFYVGFNKILSTFKFTQ